jgi:hypothetical protein
VLLLAFAKVHHEQLHESEVIAAFDAEETELFLALEDDDGTDFEESMFSLPPTTFDALPPLRRFLSLGFFTSSAAFNSLTGKDNESSSESSRMSSSLRL